MIVIFIDICKYSKLQARCRVDARGVSRSFNFLPPSFFKKKFWTLFYLYYVPNVSRSSHVSCTDSKLSILQTLWKPINNLQVAFEIFVSRVSPPTSRVWHPQHNGGTTLDVFPLLSWSQNMIKNNITCNCLSSKFFAKNYTLVEKNNNKILNNHPSCLLLVYSRCLIEKFRWELLDAAPFIREVRRS